jgi:hypothetical protein
VGGLGGACAGCEDVFPSVFSLREVRMQAVRSRQEVGSSSKSVESLGIGPGGSSLPAISRLHLRSLQGLTLSALSWVGGGSGPG